MHQHQQPRAVARLRVLEHLFVADGVAERGDLAAADHHGNAFRLARAIVVQQKPGHFGQDGLAALIVTKVRYPRAADDLLALLPPETSAAEAAEAASTEPSPTKAASTEAITAKQTAAKQTAAASRPMEVIEAAMPATQASEAEVAAAESAR